jgi:transmembrane sensor
VSKQKTPTLSGQIVEQATTWFVEFNEGEVGQPDREAFIEWLKTSPEHIRAYLQVTAHWEEAGALPKAAIPSIDDLIALAREPKNAKVIPIGGSGQSERRGERGSIEGIARELTPASEQIPRSRRYFLAASVAVVMFGASTLYWFEYQRGVYATDTGEQRSIRLGDGSTVELNARSKIRVALHQHERDVELIEGQALFQVAKDHARPFIVQSGDTNVLAVGTEFDVYKHRGSTTVTVVEGRVAVFPSTLPTAGAGPNLTGRGQNEVPSGKAPQSNRPYPSVNRGAPDSAESPFGEIPESTRVTGATKEIFLAAGEQLTVSKAAMEMAANADVAAATAWIQKQIVFNNTPLSEVVDEFNRYNMRQLVITDPKIADTKISGEFSSTNPDSLLRGLDALRKFNIHEAPGQIEISSK